MVQKLMVETIKVLQGFFEYKKGWEKKYVNILDCSMFIFIFLPQSKNIL